LTPARRIFDHRPVMSTGLDMPRAAPEHRIGRRCAVLLRCRLTDDSHEPVERFTRMSDLGAGGARILTAAPPAVGQTLTLRFRLDAQGIEIVARARVVWRSEGFRGRGGVIGVAFMAVSDPAALARFLGEG
jgi:hypothetical protein